MHRQNFHYNNTGQQQTSEQAMAAMMENDAAALAAEMFDHFSSAVTMRQIMGLFRSMCDTIGLRPGPINEFYPKLKAKIKNWKAQALWKKIDARLAHRVYNKGTACSGTRVLVIGAGPCGLRSAIEAQLLGAKVVVLEKRDRITRNNVLHLWPFLIHDLRALGAKKFYGKFCAGSIDHISIRQLQCLMLKISLLLGIEIHEGVSFEGLVEPSDGLGWRCLAAPSDHPITHYEFDVLIGADGKRNTLSGFGRKEFRGKLAIAITANFINRRTEEEARIEEISGVAFIFNQSFFKELYHQTGIDLENIVYYKDDTHYFVMTAKKHSLLDKGVIIQDFSDPAELLHQNNVNTQKLQDYAREAADFSTKYQMPSFEFAVNHYGKPDVAMFDFTSMFAAENSSRMIVRKNYRLLMCIVGDSLLEPFWPSGSGCARGFLSAMDAAYAIKLFSNSNNSLLSVLSQRESIYRLLAQTTPENLHRDHGGYTLDPMTRYPNLNRQFVLPHQVKHLLDTDDPTLLELTYMDTNTIQSLPEPPIKTRKRRTADTTPMANVLLAWIRSHLKDQEFISEIVEPSQIFTNGKVLCALIHRYRPDLCDWNAIENALPEESNEIAFSIFEKEFKIPRVMSADESITLQDIDIKTWLHYLEQICEVFRGEIPHVKHPKLDYAEFKQKTQTQKTNNMSDFTKLHRIAAAKREAANDENGAKKSRDKLPVSPTREQNIEHRRGRKRRSYEKYGGNIDRERGITSALPRSGNILDDPFSNRIRNIEEKFTTKNAAATNKKPKDLLRAIGKIESNDWNVKEIEKKMLMSKKITDIGKSREKVPKWNREQFEARQNKMQKPDCQDPSDMKYKEIDETIKALDKQLKEGSALDRGERGKNKVASIAASTFGKKKGEENQQPAQKSGLILSSQGVSESCHFCKQRVYLMEKINAEGLVLHRSCLKCHHCHTNLRLGGYAFDRENPDGKFYCTQHFKLPPKDSKFVPKRLQHKQRQADYAAFKAQQQKRNSEERATGDDLDNRGKTPERIEFENADERSYCEEEADQIMDENEWTDLNFGTGDEDSVDDESSSDETDTDSDSDNFEDPVGVDAQTLQLASDWIDKRSTMQDSEDEFYGYSSEDDDADSQTEGEELAKAREMRMNEVKLQPPPTYILTDTETEGVKKSMTQNNENINNQNPDLVSNSSQSNNHIPPNSLDPSTQSNPKDELLKNDMMKKLSLKEKWLNDNQPKLNQPTSITNEPKPSHMDVEDEKKKEEKKSFLNGIFSSVKQFIKHEKPHDKKKEPTPPPKQNEEDFDELFKDAEQEVCLVGNVERKIQKFLQKQNSEEVREEADDILNEIKEEKDKLEKHMRDMEQKRFSDNMQAIKSSVAESKVASMKEVNLTKYFPKQQDKKPPAVAKNRDVKALKDVNLSKYFPSQSSPPFGKKGSGSPNEQSTTSSAAQSPLTPRKNINEIDLANYFPSTPTESRKTSTCTPPSSPLSENPPSLSRKNSITRYMVANSIPANPPPPAPKKNILSMQTVKKQTPKNEGNKKENVDKSEKLKLEMPKDKKKKHDFNMFDQLLDGATDLDHTKNIEVEIFDNLIDEQKLDLSPSQEYDKIFDTKVVNGTNSDSKEISPVQNGTVKKVIKKAAKEKSPKKVSKTKVVAEKEEQDVQDSKRKSPIKNEESLDLDPKIIQLLNKQYQKLLVEYERNSKSPENEELKNDEIKNSMEINNPQDVMPEQQQRKCENKRKSPQKSEDCKKFKENESEIMLIENKQTSEEPKLFNQNEQTFPRKMSTDAVDGNPVFDEEESVISRLERKYRRSSIKSTDNSEGMKDDDMKEKVVSNEEIIVPTQQAEVKKDKEEKPYSIIERLEQKLRQKRALADTYLSESSIKPVDDYPKLESISIVKKQDQNIAEHKNQVEDTSGPLIKEKSYEHKKVEDNSLVIQKIFNKEDKLSDIFQEEPITSEHESNKKVGKSSGSIRDVRKSIEQDSYNNINGHKDAFQENLFTAHDSNENIDILDALLDKRKSIDYESFNIDSLIEPQYDQMDFELIYQNAQYSPRNSRKKNQKNQESKLQKEEILENKARQAMMELMESQNKKFSETQKESTSNPIIKQTIVENRVDDKPPIHQKVQTVNKPKGQDEDYHEIKQLVKDDIKGRKHEDYSEYSPTLRESSPKHTKQQKENELFEGLSSLSRENLNDIFSELQMTEMETEKALKEIQDNFDALNNNNNEEVLKINKPAKRRSKKKAEKNIDNDKEALNIERNVINDNTEVKSSAKQDISNGSNTQSLRMKNSELESAKPLKIDEIVPDKFIDERRKSIQDDLIDIESGICERPIDINDLFGRRNSGEDRRNVNTKDVQNKFGENNEAGSFEIPKVRPSEESSNINLQRRRSSAENTNKKLPEYSQMDDKYDNQIKPSSISTAKDEIKTKDPQSQGNQTEKASSNYLNVLKEISSELIGYDDEPVIFNPNEWKPEIAQVNVNKEPSLPKDKINQNYTNVLQDISNSLVGSDFYNNYESTKEKNYSQIIPPNVQDLKSMADYSDTLPNNRHGMYADDSTDTEMLTPVPPPRRHRMADNRDTPDSLYNPRRKMLSPTKSIDDTISGISSTEYFDHYYSVAHNNNNFNQLDKYDLNAPSIPRETNIAKTKPRVADDTAVKYSSYNRHLSESPVRKISTTLKVYSNDDDKYESKLLSERSKSLHQRKEDFLKNQSSDSSNPYIREMMRQDVENPINIRDIKFIRKHPSVPLPTSTHKNVEKSLSEKYQPRTLSSPITSPRVQLSYGRSPLVPSSSYTRSTLSSTNRIPSMSSYKTASTSSHILSSSHALTPPASYGSSSYSTRNRAVTSYSDPITSSHSRSTSRPLSYTTSNTNNKSSRLSSRDVCNIF
ncbi:F-actin-monooxygenase Mical isoform X2 [Chironomus tepperi]|uniref:F-actin-monooxygenase Mical isoform X2 n=1 Tax=Chironomus tepperi TaxID=113505 RepID=UPI00391EED98